MAKKKPHDHPDVNVHMVMPDEHPGHYDVHTHGLEDRDHKELQALVPGYCAVLMADFLHRVARDIGAGVVRFNAGETLNIGPVVCGLVEVPGDDPEEDPTRLRLVDLPGACECDTCGKSKGG